MSNPLAQQDRSGTAPSDPSRDPFNIPSEVKASIRVLVVDDERTLRESCASVLQMDGYNVTLVGRGEEALETVKRRKFDIILVDLYMSQISGLEILRATLQAYKDTIVVVMTGNPSVTSSIEALRAGAWDYLPKPFSRHPSPGADRPRVARGHDVARGPGPPGPAHEAERPQRQDRPDRHLAALPQGGGAGPQGGRAPTPRCSSAARAAPARRSSPSSSTRTAGAPAGRWCRSTARRCPSRCSRARCSATGRAPSPGPTGTSPACSRPPTAARCSSTS